MTPEPRAGSALVVTTWIAVLATAAIGIVALIDLSGPSPAVPPPASPGKRPHPATLPSRDDGPGRTEPAGAGQARRDKGPPCTAPAQALNFTAYWAGPSFDGLPVTAVVRECDRRHRGEPTRANLVSYLYGDCAPGFDRGCAVPIEVQTWPASERYMELYSEGPEELQLPHEHTRWRRFPALRFEDRLEIFASDVTIVVFGEASRGDRFASVLVPGPVVLTDLKSHGIEFEAGCVNDPHSCTAHRA